MARLLGTDAVAQACHGQHTHVLALWSVFAQLQCPSPSYADGCFAVWGMTMAAYAHNIQPHELALQTTMFAVGSTLIHSAACVLNDICDIEFDRKVGECPRSDFFMHLGSNANVDAMLA